MPPRLHLQPTHTFSRATTPYICLQCRHASLATTPSPPPANTTITAAPPIARYPPTQPPSHKPPEFRKSQLHRQYQSLLRSTPLTLIFQHNNLKANEWMGVRRELANALRKVDEEEMAKQGEAYVSIADASKMVVVQTGIFASALRVVEFWDPKFDTSATTAPAPSAPPPPADVDSLTPSATTSTEAEDYTHGLSTPAWTTSVKSHKRSRAGHGLEPLLSGPLALLTFPSVSPAHVAAALRILSPHAPAFPAPRRKANPVYHEPAVQNGLHKLLLLAARVEGRVLDLEGTRWLGGIEGGMEGLRAQLVAILQGVGAGVTNVLEGTGKSLYFAVEGRRGMLEEEGKGFGGGEV